MGGSAERVVPLLVGVIAFVFLIAIVCSNLGPLGGSSTIPGGGLNIYGTTDPWDPSPATGSYNITINSSRVDATYPVYPHHANNFTKSGKQTVVFYVVRNNVNYKGKGEQYELYRDFIIFDQHGGLFNLGLARFAVSYGALNAIANGTDDCYAQFYLTLWGTNYSVTVTTAGDDAQDFTSYLWNNDYLVTFSTYEPPSGPANSGDVLQTVLWIFTLSPKWLPTYPLIAFLTSLFVDATITLCVVRLIWGG